VTERWEAAPRAGAGGTSRFPQPPSTGPLARTGRFTAGQATVLRYVAPQGPVGALPVVVAADRPLPALYLAAGAPVRWPTVGGRPIRDVSLEERFTSVWGTEERAWAPSHVLILSEPGAAHSVWLFWDAPAWHFSGWYVNLEDPWRRSSVGFDTRDHTLDIWVEPDRSWQWKDEDELEIAVRVGYHSEEEAALIRAEGERVVERIDAWQPPFSEPWQDWRPDPTWPAPALPADWDASG
jgi:uncharacterized protein